MNTYVAPTARGQAGEEIAVGESLIGHGMVTNVLWPLGTCLTCGRLVNVERDEGHDVSRHKDREGHPFSVTKIEGEPPVEAFPGYTLGAGASGEPDRMEVCAHGHPLGWSCIGCGKDRDGYPNSRPARRARPPRFVLRAVCNHCASRVWLDEPDEKASPDLCYAKHNDGEGVHECYRPAGHRGRHTTLEAPAGYTMPVSWPS